jgi:hypothetical protein
VTNCAYKVNFVGSLVYMWGRDASKGVNTIIVITHGSYQACRVYQPLPHALLNPHENSDQLGFI